MKTNLLFLVVLTVFTFSFSSCETDDAELQPLGSVTVIPPVVVDDAPIIINEVLYDPSNNGFDGDANGDGNYSQDDDSFIELFNAVGTLLAQPRPLGTAQRGYSGYVGWLSRDTRTLF
jgi:hypothetical protein